MHKPAFLLLISRIEMEFLIKDDPDKIFDTFAENINGDSVFSESNFINFCMKYGLFSESKISGYIGKGSDYLAYNKEAHKNLELMEANWRKRVSGSELINSAILHLKQRLELKEMIQCKMNILLVKLIEYETQAIYMEKMVNQIMGPFNSIVNFKSPNNEERPHHHSRRYSDSLIKQGLKEQQHISSVPASPLALHVEFAENELSKHQIAKYLERLDNYIIKKQVSQELQ